MSAFKGERLAGSVKLKLGDVLSLKLKGVRQEHIGIANQDGSSPDCTIRDTHRSRCHCG